MSMLSSYRRPFRASINLAEVVGFEPTEGSHLRQFSKLLLSTTQAHFLFLAPRPGLEPGTNGLTVRHSTN
jgi:hypothetical protein